MLLEDNTEVKGFLGESYFVETGACEDITSFGGWRAFVAHKARAKPKTTADRLLVKNTVAQKGLFDRQSEGVNEKKGLFGGLFGGSE